MAAPSPRKKKTDRQENVETAMTVHDNHLIFISPQKIIKKLKEILTINSEKKGFELTDSFSCQVTHIVSGCDTRDQLLRLMVHDEELWCDDINIVRTQWLSDCLKAGKIIDVEAHHLLPRAKKDEEEKEDSSEFPIYACQRATPLNHHNEHITDPLEILAKAADFKDDKENYSRALAFRRAACVFKSLPAPVRSIRQLTKLHHIGSHVKRVIQDVLETGFSTEAEQIRTSDWFKTITIFTGIFGVGPATANKWFRIGLRTIADVRQQTNLDNRISLGLTHHEDLTLPVLRSEADAVLDIVSREVERITPGCNVTITGGFRRGKPSGHDVDILISHPVEGRELGLLPRLLQRLNSLQLILDGKHEQSTCNESVLRGSNTKGEQLKSTLDHFEKWVGIMKLEKKHRFSELKSSVGDRGNCSSQVHRMPEQSDAMNCGNGQNIHGNSQDLNMVGASTSYNSQDVDLLGASTSGNSQIAGVRRSPRKRSSSLKHSTDSNVLSSDVAKTEQMDSRDDSFRVKKSRVHKNSGCFTDIPATQSSSHDDSSDISLPQNTRTPDNVGDSDRSWYARRVDLIVAPASQYYYALVGWTGSKHFNRALRLYSQRHLAMKLNSHALYDTINKQLLPAKSEQEVFENLKIVYREPTDRNC